MFTGLVVVGLAGLSVLLWHRPPTSNRAAAAWERQDQLARSTIASDRSAIAFEQATFERVVRDTLSGWKCNAEGQPYKARVEINFSLSN